MDVSIAVSLIRGQMGTVVERAVNGAVETVLAEMLKVVGVKFEELKAQVSSLKKELTVLQREKILREKDNDKTRAMLRYAELKLKYYRQGVEEEMLQQRGHAQGVELPPRISGHGSRSRPPPARLSSSSSLVAVEAAPSEDHMDTPPPPLTLKEGVARKEEGEESDECVWAELSLQPITMDLLGPASGLQPITMDLAGPAPGPSSAPLPSPDLRPQADSSTMIPQVKQEDFQQEEEDFQQGEEEFQQEEEVICIKEEVEEPQEVLATLLPDFHLPGPLPGSEEARSQWTPALFAGQQRSHMGQRLTFSSAAHSYFMAHQAAAPTMGGGGFRGGPVVLAGPSRPRGGPSSVLAVGPPRPPSRPSWSKDLSLYEEYKLRRNELRRRSINRRREMEKALPQPLLADLVRERREKTRLRVARWRAKRKLQQQVGGGAGAQSFVPHHHQQQEQQLRVAPSNGQQRRISPASPQFNSMTSSNTFPASLSSSAPPPEQQANQHAVTSSSSNPASHAQLGLSQPGISLTDVQLGLSQAGVSLTDSDFFPVL